MSPQIGMIWTSGGVPQVDIQGLPVFVFFWGGGLERLSFVLKVERPVGHHNDFLP